MLGIPQNLLRPTPDRSDAGSSQTFLPIKLIAVIFDRLFPFSEHGLAFEPPCESLQRMRHWLIEF